MSDSTPDKQRIWDACQSLWERGEPISSSKVLSEMGLTTSRDVLRQISVWKQQRIKNYKAQPLPQVVIETMEQLWLHLQWQADNTIGEDTRKMEQANAECNRMAAKLNTAQESVKSLTEVLHSAERNADRLFRESLAKIEALEAQLANEKQRYDKMQRQATAEMIRLKQQQMQVEEQLLACDLNLGQLSTENSRLLQDNLLLQDNGFTAPTAQQKLRARKLAQAKRLPLPETPIENGDGEGRRKPIRKTARVKLVR